MTTQPNTCKDCGKLLGDIHTCSPQVANTNDADREAMAMALIERLGPHQLAGDKMSLIEAFEHGFETGILHARKVPEWLPIESAPKDGHLILCANGRSFIGTWCYIPFQEYRSEDGVYLDQQDEQAYWMDIADGEELEPTHWMPLPAAPALQSTDKDEG